MEATSSLHIDRQWWTAHLRDEAPHDLLTTLVDEIRQQQMTLAENTRRLIGIYEFGYFAEGVGGASSDTDPQLDENRNAYNFSQGIVDTVWARIIKQEIQPMSLTSGGTYMQRQRAKDMTEALEGEFAENDWEKIKEDMVLDSLVTYHGAGAGYVYNNGKRVKIERIHPDDVWFDESELRYRSPRSCYMTRGIDRFVLLAIYGKESDDFYGTPTERREAILNATRTDRKLPWSNMTRAGQDQIDTIGAWHLPSEAGCELEQTDGGEDDSAPDSSEDVGKADDNEGSGDGRFVLAIHGCTLESKPWERDHFPVFLYVPRPRRRSIWGRSLMFDLVPPQREYEILTERFQRAHAAVGYAQLYASRQSNVDARELTNGIGFVFEGDGPSPPVPFAYDPIPASAYSYRDSIPRDAMAAKGVSQFAAQGQLPAGLRQASGKALDAWVDEDSEHLIPEYRALERLVVDVSWLIVEEWRALTANDNNYLVRYRSKKGIKKIFVRDVLMDKEDCVIKVFPVSGLMKSPSGKFKQVSEMFSTGAIDKEQFKRLLGIPDLESENEIDLADIEVIDAMLDAMIMTGEYISPEGFDSLQLALTRTGKFYNLLRKNNILSKAELGDGYVPEDRMQLIRDFMDDTEARIEELQAKDAAASMPAAPPMPEPPGAPMPAPNMAPIAA
jgi:hypothetical protein